MQYITDIFTKFLHDFSENRGIGKNNELPWKLKAELKHFANLTKSTNNPDKKVKKINLS